MARLAIFIDGAYVEKVIRPLVGGRPDFGKLAEEITNTVHEKTPEPVDRLRTLYYNCPPYQSNPPTEDERNRYAGYRRFKEALGYLERFELREGRLAHRGMKSDGTPDLVQKRVDLLLGLDIALYSGKQQVSHIVLVAGDSDFIPAISVAKAEGVSTWLFHGPVNTYHRDLWREADERCEITQDFADKCRLDSNSH